MSAALKLSDLPFESKRVLVLNKNWTPLDTIPLPEALGKLVSTYDNGLPKAKVVHPTEYYPLTWADWSEMRPEKDEDVVRCARFVFKIPEVILLSKYDKIKKPRNTFSRRLIFKRDNYTCQYCGKKPGSEELNIDHVLPSSKGGLTTWENCVLSCVECNSRKADRTPQQAGMHLNRMPCKPPYAMMKGETIQVKSWEAFLGECYWNVPLVD
jgi:5-methylcytosine-specific restriction endonuclease McrA